MIYFIATPIGNLKDVTIRALKILRSCKYIICEDTRRTSVLLNKYHIKNREFIIYNDFNKLKVINRILDLTKENDLCFVSDAGMPIISDPGFKLVRELIEKNISYTVIPGPSSSLTALCLSGMTPDKFTFLGFLPKSKNKKIELLKLFVHVKTSIIIFENQNRVVKTLEIILDVFGNINAAIVRELTKIYEQVIRGNVKYLLKKLENKKLKGEIVIIVENKEPQNNNKNFTEYIDKLKKCNFTNKEIKKILKALFNFKAENIYKLI